MQLFWRKGYSATSIEDLVDALHLSRSSLYDTFGDKRTLFLDALKLYSKGVLGRVTALSDSQSPIAGINAIFDELAASAESESGAMGCFMVNSIAELVPYDPDVTAIAAGYNRTFQRLLTKALERASAAELDHSNQPPEQLAAYLFNAIQGIRVLIKSGASSEQIQAISAITLASLQ